MANLVNRNFGEYVPDNLISDLSVAILVKGVTLKSGLGELKRGTVLGIVTETKQAAPVDSTKADGTQTADAILTDDVTVGTDPLVAQAYASGLFNRKALAFGGTDTADTHEDVLRTKGIFLKDNQAY
jgi:hypothetical protein